MSNNKTIDQPQFDETTCTMRNRGSELEITKNKTDILAEQNSKFNTTTIDLGKILRIRKYKMIAFNVGLLIVFFVLFVLAIHIISLLIN